MNEEHALDNPLSESEQNLKVIDSIQQIVSDFADTAAVEAVYGKPVKNGDITIIPTAEVLCGMGVGMGIGSGGFTPPDEASPKAQAKGPSKGPNTPQQGSGAGGGGGGYTFSRPVAVVIASPEGVRVEPVIDRTKIAIAAFTTAGFMLSMISRMFRGK